MRRSRWRRLLVAVAGVGLVATATPAAAASPYPYITSSDPMLTLVDPVAGSSLLPIIDSGDELEDGFLFEGIPDGIGVMPGPAPGTADVFVNHEQSHVPFLGLADFEDSSVSRLTLDTSTGEVLAADVPLDPSLGLLRFCSATMAGPKEGLDRYLFFTNEETNDVVPVPPGAPYGPDPSLAPDRQGGYSVVLDPSDDSTHVLRGAGRLNHENTMVVPGRWNRIAMLTGDDTFFTPPFPDWAQLYLYLARDEDAILADEGRLYAFRVTRTDEGRVRVTDPFNGANDYGDIEVGDRWRGRFIPVPRRIAEGRTDLPPQKALELWSNRKNVFQFIRVEDSAYDPNRPRVVYLADTGDGRMIPDPATGRLTRGPSGTIGDFPNGRIFELKFHPKRPRFVTSFSILLDADAGGRDNPDVLHNPDNMGTSRHSLMVQEDTSQLPGSRVWRYDLDTGTWSVVAAVDDGTTNESSGIVSAARWFGPGTWLLNVQGHDTFIDEEVVSPELTLKREAGQLVLMTIPGS